MAEFKRINEPRVEKILHMLEVIQKSARSNRVDPDEIRDLLLPIIGATGLANTARTMSAPVSPASTPEPEPVTHRPQGTPRLDMTIRELAETAPLADLTFAVAVFLNRIDQHLANHPA